MEETQTDGSSRQISTQTFLIENVSSIYTYKHIIIYHIYNIYIFIIENPVRRWSSQKSVEMNLLPVIDKYLSLFSLKSFILLTFYPLPILLVPEFLSF